MDRILLIQQQLNVPKNSRAQSYNYRTIADTLKALLPLLKDNGLTMLLPVELTNANGVNYVVAHCLVMDAADGRLIAETTYPTMDSNAMIKGGQGTGAACTYAKKGAIDSMFLLDANNPDALDLDDHEALKRAAAKIGQAKETKAEPKAQAQACPQGKKELTDAVLTDGNWLAWASLYKTPEALRNAMAGSGYWMSDALFGRFRDAVTDYRVSNGMA